MGVPITSVLSFVSGNSGNIRSNPRAVMLTGYENVSELRQTAKEACSQFDISTADLVKQEQDGSPYVALSLFSQRHLPINDVINYLNCTRDLGLLIRRINYVISSKLPLARAS